MLETEVSATVQIRKKSPTIKVSSGIGDSDGYPAFDEEAEAYTAPQDRKWGFRITGGADFHMPITVFQVSEHSLAADVGIRLGDIILQINEIDAKNLTLAKAQELINSAETNLHLIVKNMDDEENTEQQQSSDEKSVVLRAPPSLREMEPPREFHPTPLLDRKYWHPIMWENPPPKADEPVEGEEAPHKRIIRNIKRFLKESKDKPELRKKHIEDMLLVLPGASKGV